MQQGHTLIEILVSLTLITLGIFGSLKMDIVSQQTQNQANVIQRVNRSALTLYEILQGKTEQQNACPACRVLSENHNILLDIQAELMKISHDAKVDVQQVSVNQIKMKICYTKELCKEEIIWV